jgi:hypothetical protein
MAVPRRVRRFINAGVPVTLDCKYAKSNTNNKGIVRSLRRVNPNLLPRLHALLTLMVHHYRRFALTSSGARDHPAVPRAIQDPWVAGVSPFHLD